MPLISFSLLLVLPLLVSSWCPDTCLTCISKYLCTSCLANHFLKDRQCQLCDTSNKLFICSQQFFDWSLSIPQFFNGQLFIKFNKAFEMQTPENLSQILGFTLGPNIPDNGGLSVRSLEKKDLDSIEVGLDVAISFRNKRLNVSISDPFFFFDQENNFLVGTQKSIEVPLYVKYRSIETSAVKGFVYFIEAFIAALLVYLWFTEYFHLFWLLLDTLQTLNVYFFVNTVLPPILSTFLSSLGALNFDFMGHLLYDLFTKLTAEQIIGIVPPVFTDYTKGASFLYNFGDLLSLLVFMLISLFFLIGFMKRHAKNAIMLTGTLKSNKFSKETTESIHANLLLIVGKNLEWKVILKYLEIVNYNLLLGTLLALRYCGFERTLRILDFVFAVLFSVAMAIVLRQIFKIINNTFVFIGNKEHYRKYGVLFENIDIKRFWARNFSLFISFQKLILVICAVTLYETGFAQIAAMIGTQLMFTLCIFLSLPFYETLQNVLYLIVQALLLIELFLLLGIKLAAEETLSQEILDSSRIEVEENLAFAGFAVAVLIFLVFSAGIIFLSLRKHRERKNKAIELNNLSGNSSKRTLADKYNLA